MTDILPQVFVQKLNYSLPISGNFTESLTHEGCCLKWRGETMPRETQVAARLRLFGEVSAERDYQDEKWGGAYVDNGRTEEEWLTWINEYANGTGRAEGYEFRKRMVKTAALALAALEAHDRNQAGGPG